MLPLVLLAALGAGFFLMKKGDANAPADHTTLDATLPPDLAQAVVIAVQNETNPTRLRAFEASLLPDFPLAAAMLEQAAHQRDQLSAASAATH